MARTLEKASAEPAAAVKDKKLKKEKKAKKDKKKDKKRKREEEVTLVPLKKNKTAKKKDKKKDKEAKKEAPNEPVAEEVPAAKQTEDSEAGSSVDPAERESLVDEETADGAGNDEGEAIGSLDALLKLNRNAEEALEEETGLNSAQASSTEALESSTVFVGNMSFKIDEDTVWETFKDCGEKGYDSIKAVRFGFDENGEFKRYAHVDFDTPASAANALKLNGVRVLNKELTVQIAAGPKDQGPGSSFVRPSEPVKNPDYVDRCIVKNLSYDITEEVLFHAFEQQGVNCKHCSFVNDRETGQFYGTGFVTFETADDAAWAVACSNAGMEILARHVRVEYCPHRNDRKKAAMAAAGKAPEGKSGAVPAHGKRSDVARPPSARPEGGTITAFFGNLGFEIEDANLVNFCKDIGEVKNIRWLEDKTTGEFKGAGFADFADPETVDKIVQTKNGKKLLGRVVRVDYAPNTKTKHKTKAGTN